ncbi:MAG TPA: response regulator transcription factor [Thermoanaerobacterales bacterium]|jgi:DNA-binding response OmpR family regulator|nr:response regulator transcription factor [Thermoanaerobacterales bacterium]
MGKNKILVVDDEIKLLALIKNYLEKEGFVVFAADGGQKALDIFEIQKPDLVVLDIMMPDVSGYDVCKKICAVSKTPVIMLTAKAEEIDKLLGLELGADDYITKPFSLRELTARIRAVLRRVNRQSEHNTESEIPDHLLEYQDIKLDIKKKMVTRNGEVIELTPTEYKILEMLISNQDMVFSRLQILEQVLGDYYEGYDRSLDTHISNLRKKLGDDPIKPNYIKTVYGMGYKMGG